MGEKGVELLLTDVYTELVGFLKEERSTVDGHFFGGKIRIEPVLTNLNEERVWENLKEKKNRVFFVFFNLVYEKQIFFDLVDLKFN